MAPSLSEAVREQLTGLASNSSSSSGHLAIDFYREAQEQAQLLYQTECVRRNLAEDPFQALEQLDTGAIGKRIRVVDYDCVRTRQDYVRIQAKVEVKGNGKSALSSNLVFLFEREATETGTVLTYSISFSLTPCQASQKILWVQVVAAGNHPSQSPAINMEASSDDDWSDVPSDEEDRPTVIQAVTRSDSQEVEQERKRVKMSDDQLGQSGCIEPKKPASECDDVDRYVAGIDPDALAVFVDRLLGKMDDATALFLLMTFPFYEMEWDLVGFILDSAFDSPKDDGSADGSSMIPKE